MEQLIQKIRAYTPCCEQEERDQKAILAFLEKNPDALTRENETAHVSASAWVLNQDKTKALMVYHNIYQSWSWTGGHADGEADLLAVAIREAREETGVVTIVPLSNEIFSLEIMTVDGHIKHGHYVPSHLHLNVTYLLSANDQEAIRIKEDENGQVAWIPIEEIEQRVSEPWVMHWIYSKLINKSNNRYI